MIDLAEINISHNEYMSNEVNSLKKINSRLVIFSVVLLTAIVLVTLKLYKEERSKEKIIL